MSGKTYFFTIASRDSPTNDLAKSSEANAATPSIILNICGRVVMIQTEAAATGGDQAAEQAQQMVSPLAKRLIKFNRPGKHS